MSKVFCIVVTYNPDIELLVSNVRSILDNNVVVVLVDNGSSNQEEIVERFLEYEHLFILTLSENRGIAAAQNVGIQHAYNNGGDFFWLSDQDTNYSCDYKKKACKFLEAMSNEGRGKLGVLAPVFYDNNRGAVQPVVKFSPFTKKFMAEPGMNSVSHVIASGMIIPRKAIDVVGYKNEKLFIDWVDMEWCWRAGYVHGLDIIVCGDLCISHSLGDTFRTIFGKKIIFRSPFRHYHMVRNAIYLALRSSYLPLPVRCELFFKSLVWVCVFPVFSKVDKKKQLMAVLKGFRDGVVGKWSYS